MYLIVPSAAAVLLFFLPESPVFLAKSGKEQVSDHWWNNSSQCLPFTQPFIFNRKWYSLYLASKKITQILPRNWSWKPRKCWSRNSIKCWNNKCWRDTSVKIVNEWLQWVSQIHLIKRTLRITISIEFLILATRQAKKAYLICFVTYALSFLAGVNVMRDFVSEVFQQTDSAISIKNSSLVISSVAFVGNVLCVMIIERFSRKSLFIGSSIVTASGYFAFSIYCYFWLHHPDFKWMPLLCFAWTVFFSTLGSLAIPYTLAAEIFPVKVY